MRVTLLPREAAARVITGAVAKLAWAAGAAIIVMAIPVLVLTLLREGAYDALALPLAILLLILAAILVAMWRMTPAVVAGYLVFATAAAVVYEVSLIRASPALLGHELFVINRPSLVLVTVGVSAASALGGIAWCVTGYLAAWAVSLASAMLTDTPVRPGFGPTMVLAVAIMLYLTLFAIQARQRHRFPRFEELEEATRRRAASADMARRTTAIVHDTVLNDLAVVMNAPDTLDGRTRERLRDDLDTLAGGAWMRTTSQVEVPDETQSAIRNQLARLASEFRWRGLTVNLMGLSDGVYRYEPAAAEALIGALRATLENVLQHAGSPVADVEIMYSDTEVTLMVSDEGVGFDATAVDPSRLGIRESVLGRMEGAGGRARIWSAPGTGTTVLLSIPIIEVRDAGSPSRHQVARRAD